MEMRDKAALAILCALLPNSSTNRQISAARNPDGSAIQAGTNKAMIKQAFDLADEFVQESEHR